jgi:hypothetical protein
VIVSPALLPVVVSLTRDSNYDAFAVFPSNGATIRRLASLPAVRVVPFPRFAGTIEALRLPADRPAALRCLRLAVPHGASWHSLPPPKNATAVDRECFGFGHSPAADESGGDGRISQVPGKPQRLLCHVLRLRQDCTPLTIAVRQHGPRLGNGEGSHIGTFEARSHGLEASCLRFAGWVTPPPRKTRFQVRVRLSWAGLVTRRVSTKGFELLLTSQPPFPSLLGAIPIVLFWADLTSQSVCRRVSSPS